MLSSAMSSAVKSARKMKKVVATDSPGSFDTPTPTGIRSWMTQGWRPTSATTQPACEAR